MEDNKIIGKRLLTVQDVSALTGCSVSKSYRIIKRLNYELRTLGYIVVSGRVDSKYFETRYPDCIN